MTTTLTRADILSLPKIDLHRHLDGAVRADFLFKLAGEVGVKLPTDNLEEFTKLYQITYKDMPISELFKRFAWPIAAMRHPRGLYRTAKEFACDLKRENIWYAELRFAPGYHSIYPPPWYSSAEYEKEPFPVMPLDQVMRQVLGGLKKGMKDTGVIVNVIVSIPRESLTLYGPKSVTDIIDLALRFQNEGVVAIDLACDELSYPPTLYGKYFRSTLGSKLRRDPHAGEMGPDDTRLKNISDAITNLSADGLGHAVPLYQSEYLMQLAKANNIRVERTPLSPVPGCSLADGHLDELLKHNVPVVITSDDPALMQTSLTDNWLAALNYHGFGEAEFWQMTDNAINTAFYRDEEQRHDIQKLFGITQMHRFGQGKFRKK